MPQTLKHAFEGFFILAGILLFRLLPLDVASYIGGFLLRFLGPFSRAHKIAITNIEYAMPELSEAERLQIVSGMWDNIGRVIGEYPHLARPAMARRVQVEGRQYMEQIRDSKQAALIISGHFSNWEIAPLATSLCGVPTVVIYREASNPVAEWLTIKMRENYTRSLHNKGREGAIQSVKAMKDGHALALLIDQKMNDGSPISFFGHEAMTAVAAARLAIKYQVPVVAGRVVRAKGAHFTLIVEPPKYYAPDTDAIAVTQEFNHMLERWVRTHPEQWFWVHNRWGKRRKAV